MYLFQYLGMYFNTSNQNLQGFQLFHTDIIVVEVQVQVYF